MESSVASLMEHLGGVETRRRVTMMRRKEAETRLAFATEEGVRLEQQQQLNTAAVAELKRALEHHLEQQRSAQLRRTTGADALRHGEATEVLLLERARAAAARGAALVAAWETNTRELDELQRSWEDDEAALPLHRRSRQLAEEAAALLSKREQLEREVREATQRRTETVIPQPPPTTTEGGDVTVIQLTAQIGLSKCELTELQAQHARQMAALDREVADLNSRSMELAQWLADTVGSRDQVLMSIQMLQSCLSSGVCASCRPSS
ncbi:uncharacterized protein TM35_000072610 [Trypanosoma theileri]|uniref:Uncharacterized protein n=1 Tax=Trypanosoma theileri TaxID=67003 RepID=A0A1X0P1M8_9TRYP|nr:uncharacterized protein TM35_000072610 [Trypanosoma theileri]ORC90837.1 hypothetical protein TM35_000072610 [Trypanosoma theileri]